MTTSLFGRLNYDSNGKIFYADNNFCEMTGYSSDELYQNGLRLLFLNDLDYNNFLKNLRNLKPQVDSDGKPTNQPIITIISTKIKIKNNQSIRVRINQEAHIVSKNYGNTYGIYSGPYYVKCYSEVYNVTESIEKIGNVITNAGNSLMNNNNSQNSNNSSITPPEVEKPIVTPPIIPTPPQIPQNSNNSSVPIPPTVIVPEVPDLTQKPKNNSKKFSPSPPNSKAIEKTEKKA
jgi:hypothetical protein